MSDSWDPMDYNPSGSSVHGISQSRILKWVAISFSRGSSWPRDQTCVSCIVSGFFTAEPSAGSPGTNYKCACSSSLLSLPPTSHPIPIGRLDLFKSIEKINFISYIKTSGLNFFHLFSSWSFSGSKNTRGKKSSRKWNRDIDSLNGNVALTLNI